MSETPASTKSPPADESRVARLLRVMHAAIQDEGDELLKPVAPIGRRTTTEPEPATITKLSRKVLAPKATRLGDRASQSRKGHGHRTEMSYRTPAGPNAFRNPVVAPVVANFALSPPPIPLQNRAVHPYFLREMLRTGVCPVSRLASGSEGPAAKGEVFGGPNRYAPHSNWSCNDFVDFAIKPSTAESHMSFVQALVCNQVSLPWVGRKELGSEGRFNAQDIPVGPAGFHGKSIFGPATYFVSFSYDYQFSDVCSAIIAHYESLPEALAAASVGQIAPIYYWLSIFATNKNHGSDIRKNPDGDPSPAIHRSKAVLLACKPWHDPACLSRAWVLYELVTALDAGVEVQILNLERDISLNDVFPDGSIKEAKEAFASCLSTLDIQQAVTSNPIDHGWLCSLVEKHHPGGSSTLQPALQSGLKPALMGALLTLVLKREVKDYDLATKLVQGEGGDVIMQWGSAFIGGPTQGGDAAATFFALALGKSKNTVRLQELVLDPDVSPSHPSGSQGLLVTRPWNVLMSQEAPSWGGGMKGLRTEGSAGVPLLMQAATLVKQPSLTPSLNGQSLEATSPVPQLSSAQPSSRSMGGKGGKSGVRGLDAAVDWTLGGWAGSSQGTPSSKSTSPSASPHVLPTKEESVGIPTFPLTKKQVQENRALSEALALSSRNEVTARGAAQLSLALSMNPGGSLMTLSLSHNSIGGQGAATIFRSLRGNFALKTLLMRDCGLDSSCCLDLGKALRSNVSLTTLDLGQNPSLLLPSSLPGAEVNLKKSKVPRFSPQTQGSLLPCHHLAAGLPKCGLRDLRMDSTGLDSFQACLLSKGISSCISLVRLDLSNNFINGREIFDTPPESMSDVVLIAHSDQANEMKELPSPSPHMASLERYRNESDSGFTAAFQAPPASRDCASLFARGIAGSFSLQCLFLGGNLMRSEGVVALAAAICKGQSGAGRSNGAGRSLRMLILRDNDIGLEAGLALSILLRESSSFPSSSGPLLISCLDLSLNPFVGDVGALSLADGVKASSSLIELRMEGVGMTSVGAAAIAEAIGRGAKAIRRLDISDNAVANAGAEAFASCLGSDSRLVELIMDRNEVGVEGRLALVSAIQANGSCSLKHLSLVGNRDPNADPRSGAKLMPGDINLTPAEVIATKLKPPPRPMHTPDDWTGVLVFSPVKSKGADRGADGSPSHSSMKGQVKVAPMSKSEQVLAQALHVGRLLQKTRGLTIY